MHRQRILIGQSFLKTIRTVEEKLSLLGEGKSERGIAENHRRFWAPQTVMAVLTSIYTLVT